MRSAHIIFFILVFYINTHAQSGFISFEKTRVDLGRINEAQFPVTYTFDFLVAGSGKVSITSVDTDCACTASKFTQTEIDAGEKGQIQVIFDPYRPGPFYKTFTVHAQNAIPKKTELIIEGFIEPFTFNPNIEFPAITADSLGFKYKAILLGSITNSQIVKKQVQVYNFGSDTLTLIDSLQSPPFIDVAFDQGLNLAPKQIHTFSLFYDPATKDDFGEITDSLTLFIEKNEDDIVTLPLYVKTSIRQYFPENLAEDNANSYPRLVASDTLLNLGRINLDQDKIVEFVLSNSGNSPLEIQKIVCNYGAEIFTVDKRTIEPLDFAKLKIAIKDINKKGTQDRRILIYCNDPNNTVTTLRVKLYGQ